MRVIVVEILVCTLSSFVVLMYKIAQESGSVNPKIFFLKFFVNTEN